MAARNNTHYIYVSDLVVIIISNKIYLHEHNIVALLYTNIYIEAIVLIKLKVDLETLKIIFITYQHDESELHANIITYFTLKLRRDSILLFSYMLYSCRCHFYKNMNKYFKYGLFLGSAIYK